MLGLNKTSGKVSDAAEIRIGWRLIGLGIVLYLHLLSYVSHQQNINSHSLLVRLLARVLMRECAIIRMVRFILCCLRNFWYRLTVISDFRVTFATEKFLESDLKA